MEIKELGRYINNITEESSYTAHNIIVEHRSNNPKRDFLFVNKVQGKHIPSKPSEIITMCKSLANLINNKLSTDSSLKVLVVSFAETATALGNIVADNLKFSSYVIQTTRENIEGSKELLTFEEEHSHATTQMVRVAEDNEIDFEKFNYVLFVDDEISTGNTIINFIKAFRKTFTTQMKFGVASICNWQNEADQEKFKELNIDTFALLTGQLKDKDQKMVTETDTNVEVFNKFELLCDRVSITEAEEDYYVARGIVGTNLFKAERTGHETNRDLNYIFDTIKGLMVNERSNKLRIIGTEEFMYIPIKIGEMLEKLGYEVEVHSTTRSSIDILKKRCKCDESCEGKRTGNCKCFTKGEGIKYKLELPSVYEKDRVTYLYNTNDIDRDTRVVLLTDVELDSQLARDYSSYFRNLTEDNYIAIVLED